jgi:hypothetical protein
MTQTTENPATETHPSKSWTLTIDPAKQPLLASMAAQIPNGLTTNSLVYLGIGVAAHGLTVALNALIEQASVDLNQAADPKQINAMAAIVLSEFAEECMAVGLIHGPEPEEKSLVVLR